MSSPSPTKPGGRARPSVQSALLLILAVGLFTRLALALTDEGIYWPDEVYQSLEPAHRLVFGYGYVAWEFIEGARNYALPLFVAVWMKLGALLGGDSPRAMLGLVEIVFCLLSVLAAAGTFRLARISGASERAALLGAAAFALCGPALYFAPRAMSENASAVAAVWGLAFTLDPKATRRALLGGASLLGLAVLFRLHTGLFAAGALGVLLARKQWAHAKVVALVLAAWAVAYGALDAATWHDAPGARFGGWFHSAVVYVRFNLIEGKAAQWGTARWTYYLTVLWRSMAIVTVAMLVGLAVALESARGVSMLALLFIGAHMAVAHKEYRFILPALPVAFAAAVVGLESLPGRLGQLGQGALALGIVVSTLTVKHLTWRELGAYPERGAQSAWDDSGPTNRLMLRAHELPDLCGLRVDVHPAWHGGFSHLHRKVPLHPPGTPPDQRLFNYAIVGKGSGLEVVAADGPMELVKIPVQCLSLDEQLRLGYSWRLP